MGGGGGGGELYKALYKGLMPVVPNLFPKALFAFMPSSTVLIHVGYCESLIVVTRFLFTALGV